MYYLVNIKNLKSGKSPNSLHDFCEPFSELSVKDFPLMYDKDNDIFDCDVHFPNTCLYKIILQEHFKVFGDE